MVECYISLMIQMVTHHYGPRQVNDPKIPEGNQTAESSALRVGAYTSEGDISGGSAWQCWRCRVKG